MFNTAAGVFVRRMASIYSRNALHEPYVDKDDTKRGNKMMFIVLVILLL